MCDAFFMSEQVFLSFPFLFFQVRSSNNATYRFGLKGYEYNFIENALDNGEFNKDNKCFCRKGRCLPRGLIDVTDCYYGKFCNYIGKLLGPWEGRARLGVNSDSSRFLCSSFFSRFPLKIFVCLASARSLLKKWDVYWARGKAYSSFFLLFNLRGR